jgi:hypothetical protein
MKLQFINRNNPWRLATQILEIELPICHATSDRPMTEIIEVVQLSPLKYRLVFSPGMVEGLAKGDEIELCSEDPKGFNVVKHFRTNVLSFAKLIS